MIPPLGRIRGLAQESDLWPLWGTPLSHSDGDSKVNSKPHLLVVFTSSLHGENWLKAEQGGAAIKASRASREER